MREILFRGKSVNNGEWVEGGYYREPYTDNVYILRWNSFGLGFTEQIVVDPDTVGQYTGLKDRNGKQIFEGDILSAHLDKKNPDDETLNFVKWCGFGWYSVQPGYDPDPISDFDIGLWTVVGNIHDNVGVI